MKRLVILAKGNADVRDSLHALVEDGVVVWNGVNTCLAARFPGSRIHVIHETMTRSDAVAQLPVPDASALGDRSPPLGPFAADAQFSTRLFEGGYDAAVLSIQADVMHPLARHRANGHLFFPYDAGNWDGPQRDWLTANYESCAPLTPDQSMRCLGRIAQRIRQVRDVPVLVYNLSPILPWEWVHNYRGTDETLGERIRQFNLALIRLSRAEGLSIVDVESVVARIGVAHAKRDAVVLTARGCAEVAAAVVRILEDHGCLSPESAAA